MACPGFMETEGVEIIAQKHTEAHLKSGTDSVTVLRRKR